MKTFNQSPIWHVLDTGSIWMKEFASALSNRVPVHSWAPVIRNFGWWEDWSDEVTIEDPPLRMTRFPLQRAYSRFPVSHLMPFASRVAQRLRTVEPHRSGGVLVCTSPFYAPVAERWPGPVIYYLTDKTVTYEGMNASQIRTLDRRLCCIADLVCPNSARTGEYLRLEAGCPGGKIVVIPNATRAQNVLAAPLLVPDEPPADIADVPRPMVGVIGNLAGNLDWELIRDAVARSGEVSWVFVGPVSMAIRDRTQSAARAEVIARGGRVRFTGPKPYGELCRYSRAFDAAFMPYHGYDPTRAASPTRFYEHLAACRPILASRGVDQLLDKEPLLKLVDSGDDVAAELRRLSACGFVDGQERARWEASHEGTWEFRAASMLSAAGIGAAVQAGAA